MKDICSFLIVLIFFIGCETKIYEVPAVDGIAVLPKVGNVKITLDFNDMTVSVLNQNAADVGVYITKYQESSIVLFGDGYIRGTKSEVQPNVYYEYGWELEVKVVVYKSLASSIASFLDTLGPNFLNEVKDFWIEETYIKIVRIPEPSKEE